MPDRHFLNAPGPLEEQVAGFLAGLPAPEQTLLITPTAGAARSVAARLAASGAKAPRARQAMQALLPDDDRPASSVERSLAWAKALRQAPGSVRQSLFRNRFPETTAELLKAARNLNRLCDRLAEAALSPQSTGLSEPAQQPMDAARWSALAELYQSYLTCLSDWQLKDPNALRIAKTREPQSGLQHLVIAAVSDLPKAFEQYADHLEEAGTRVDVLIWNPAKVPETAFDDWGRPEADFWKHRPISLDPKQITVAASTQDEARSAAAPIGKTPTDLVVVDPKLQPALASELILKGHRPYLPGGKSLLHTEAARLALGWEEFRQSRDLRRLRGLLELPAFCKALDSESPISLTDALTAIDILLGKTIANTLDAAWAAWPAEPAVCPDSKLRGKVRRLLGCVQSRLESSATELLEAAFPESAAERPESVDRLLEITRDLAASPALVPDSKNGAPFFNQVLAQALRDEQLLNPAAPDEIPLNGWLEAPWLTAPQLVLCGLIDGQLPRSVDGDPFIPDSLCPALGLSHNLQRLARDSYLLDGLLASRPAEQIFLSFSKYSPEGDPNRPSRLLLRTALDDLPERIRLLTEPSLSSRARPTRKTAWRWHLPGELPRTKRISPTQFETYLACPFRFCLKHILKLDSGPRAAHEMDASVFGNLIHFTLEQFGREAITMGESMLRMNEATIRAQVQRLLQIQAVKLFGPSPSPAVQVQIANAAARLHGFARVQAVSFNEGWVITDVERYLSADDPSPLKIGPLPLSGIIDRIEQQVDTGALRIMDFKTYSAAKVPAKTHLAPPTHCWMEEALVEIDTGRRSMQRAWKGLQLPLYRRILEHWYPKECAAQAPESAYFLLPSDPNDTAILPFDELGEALNPEAYDSALTCAEAVAKRIHERRFWPPQPFREIWDDPAGPILLGRNAEESIAAETIEKLKGPAA